METEQLGKGVTTNTDQQVDVHCTLCDECYVWKLEATLFTLHIRNQSLILRRVQTLRIDCHATRRSKVTVNSGSIAVEAGVAFRTCRL